MTRGQKDLEEYDEVPEELEENPDEYQEDPGEYFNEDAMIKLAMEESEIPKVDWAEDIEKIEDPKAREKEIEAAEEILEKEKELNDRLESGEITERDYADEHEEEVIGEKRRAFTRSFLESKGASSEGLETMFDRWDEPDMPLSERGRREGEIRKAADMIGEQIMEEMADRELEEQMISERAHKKVTDVVNHGRK